MARDSAFTDDAVFNGALIFRQRSSGYRFGLDSLLLAWYAWGIAERRVLELGTGCGVVALTLAHKNPSPAVDAVEVQPALAELARHNAARNGLDRVKIFLADLRSLRGEDWESRYDLVVCNPPYRVLGRGRLNPEEEKARARHEVLATLEDIVACAARCLGPLGNAALVVPPERRRELEDTAERLGLTLRQCCRVRPFAQRPPNQLLVTLSRQGAGRLRDSELVVFETRGRYDPDVEAIIAGRWQGLRHPLTP